MLWVIIASVIVALIAVPILKESIGERWFLVIVFVLILVGWIGDALGFLGPRKQE